MDILLGIPDLVPGGVPLHPQESVPPKSPSQGKRPNLFPPSCWPPVRLYLSPLPHVHRNTPRDSFAPCRPFDPTVPPPAVAPLLFASTQHLFFGGGGGFATLEGPSGTRRRPPPAGSRRLALTRNPACRPLPATRTTGGGNPSRGPQGTPKVSLPPSSHGKLLPSLPSEAVTLQGVLGGGGVVVGVGSSWWVEAFRASV